MKIDVLHSSALPSWVDGRCNSCIIFIVLLKLVEFHVSKGSWEAMAAEKTGSGCNETTEAAQRGELAPVVSA